MNIPFQELSKSLEGSLQTDSLHRTMYATDASIYREMPLGVAYPKHKKDIIKIVNFAKEYKVALTPRTAGTSLAGQTIGKGLIVDVSKHMTKIIEFNKEEAWVKVEPGVIRDELNAFLKPHGLWFGPITATATRAMIGGMVGNNSSGTTSIKYGVTRDHVIELETILSDGNEVLFDNLNKKEFEAKLSLESLEGSIYRQISEELSNLDVQENIRSNFPHPEIHRRNTGYAVDMLLQSNLFSESGPDFNFCNLLAGSEGTLAFSTTIKLHVDPLPPPEEILLCAHFNSLDESLRATLLAMEHQPFTCELMDKTILDCTKENRTQQKNRFFLKGDPAAVLLIEMRADTSNEVKDLTDNLVKDLESAGLGYAFPKVYPPDTKKVMALRAAGFGVLSNIKGDDRPIEFVEDTAVNLPDLPAYIAEFQELIERFGQKAVYYAHAGAGELHLRPNVNLKSKAGLENLRAIGTATAQLVKKYNGSLSGEHGDGRVRGEFIPLVLGEKNYQLFKRIKKTWDPDGIFNPGKIVDAQPMDEDLRYLQDQAKQEFPTIFNFSESEGILKLAEKCNGSGDCRKLANVSGGVLCPSYMATRDEKDTTRARANMLREMLTRPAKDTNPFNRRELKEVMDLCLSCKGCTAECPSNVDMATLKAEFLHQYYQSNGIPFRSKFFANIDKWNKVGSLFSRLTNFFLNHRNLSNILKSILGIAKERSMPNVSGTSLRSWFEKHSKGLQPNGKVLGEVYFFCDEFTNRNDVELGKKAIQLITGLGYKVDLTKHEESGRAALSKGVLFKAKKHAIANVSHFSSLVNDQKPLIGIEPSAILSFRDEYPRLVPDSQIPSAKILAKNCLMIDEFLAGEIQLGKISSSHFTTEPRHVLLHGHCHQKSLASIEPSIYLLDLPENYSVEVIPSGCCGMAGSFGYEKEHFEVSMQVGELVLFPAIRKSKKDTLLAAPGTSCRHQIKDGTGRKALHPVEILYDGFLGKR